MVEVKHIPDTKDNPHWYDQAFAEDSLHRVHNLKQAVDRYALEEGILEVDIQGNVDMVDMKAEREALPRDARPVSQIHVRDRSFGDQHAYLAQHR
jgi:hypothetical protein